jgi:endoglucanase
MAKIAAQPQADWFGDWNADVRADVAARTAQAAGARATPVYVAYDIPNRDCGGYSAGGSASAAAYRAWIDAFAAGLGQAPAIVIVEPDALAAMDCLPATDQQLRLDLIAYAVRALRADHAAALYLEAGNAAWQPATFMAQRLRDAGVGEARGFALNVANFRSTSETVAYGSAISTALGGGVPFVVDTSRNGLGPTPDAVWCNPSGRALGDRPTLDTGEPLVDAHLWIKSPGESDGTCNGGPAAGVWWPDYALGLAQRAGW